MATISENKLTLLDYLKRCKGNGSFDYQLVDFITKNNPILKDVTFVESNDGTSHTVTLATGLRRPAWAGYGEGVPHGKVNYNQLKFVAGRMVDSVMLEGDAWEEANEEGKKEMLAKEVEFTAEGMNQLRPETLFYGSIDTEPRSFNGLSSIYKICGGHLAGVSEEDVRHYVLNGAKAVSPSEDDLRTIWCVKWDKDHMTAFYPKGHASVGIEKGALSKITQERNGRTFDYYTQKLRWKAGLAMSDFRYAGAIRNIEADQMVTADGHVKTGQPNYIQLVQKLINRVNDTGSGRKALYMPKIVWENLMTIFGNLTQSNAITFEDVDQYRKVPHLYGIPVACCRCLDRDETFVPLAQ